MTRPRELRFNAFNMTAPSHNWAGLWPHPRNASIDYNTLDYWVDYAKTAERGLLDGIFLADVFGVYDVYHGNADAAALHAVQLPSADPTLAGSPQDVADELVAWADETDVDGFNLFGLVAPESLNAFVDLVVPELQSRGVYKTAYRDGTLREKLFPGRGPAAAHDASWRGFSTLSPSERTPIRRG